MKAVRQRDSAEWQTPIYNLLMKRSLLRKIIFECSSQQTFSQTLFMFVVLTFDDNHVNMKYSWKQIYWHRHSWWGNHWLVFSTGHLVILDGFSGCMVLQIIFFFIFRPITPMDYFSNQYFNAKNAVIKAERQILKVKKLLTRNIIFILT